MKDIIFCSMITEDYKNSKVEFDLFYKSFIKFNPGIKLEIFEDNDIKKIFNKNSHANFTNWKTSLAKELYNDYKYVVVLDSDHFIFSRLDEILETNYDVAIPSNYNDFANVSIFCASFMNGNQIEVGNLIDEENYYQGGLISGTKDFWDAYDFACKKHSQKFNLLGENNVLNLLVNIYPFNLKILDGDTNYRKTNFKSFYNCSSLNLEQNFNIIDDSVFCFGKQVKMYHVARGGNSKIKFDNLFNDDVKNWFYKKIGDIK